MLKLKTNRTLVLSIMLLGSVVASHAGVLYSALPNQSGASDLNCCLEADDFTLVSASTITQLTFWSLQGVPSDYAGSIPWSINLDASGVPGVSVASGLASPTGVSTGNSAFGFNEFSFTWGVSVGLAPGTYWVVLHNGPTDTVPTTDFFWEWSNGDAGNSQSQDLLTPSAPWTGNFSELAMELDGVSGAPEPASWLLFGAGLLGIRAMRNRKK